MSKNNPAMENVKAPDVPTEQPAKENKLGYRILALLLLAVSVLAILLVPFNVLKGTSAEVVSASLFQTILDLFKNGTKLFNLVPIYPVATGAAKIAYNGTIYLFAGALVIAAIINIFAMITGKKGVIKAALFFLMGGALLYTICYYLAAVAINLTTASLEVFSLVIAVVCALIYFALSIKTAGKSVWVHLLQLVLTAAFSLALVWAIAPSKALTTPLSALGVMEYLLAVVVVLTVINVLWATLRMEREKAYVIDIVRLVFAIAISAIALVDAIQGKSNMIFAIVAICIALVQLVIAVLALLKSRKKEEEPVEEPADDGFAVEEYAEAYPYEGGPVAGVLMAQEVNPSFIPHEPHVNTAGYDFYNSKAFDPFIATLTTEERNEFTEVFILKFKGTMSELPDYVVGGDNKEFFRKIFIYLGQYRDRISSKLLGKMYQYSLKI